MAPRRESAESVCEQKTATGKLEDVSGIAITFSFEERILRFLVGALPLESHERSLRDRRHVSPFADAAGALPALCNSERDPDK